MGLGQWTFYIVQIWHHQFGAYAKFSEKRVFLTPILTHTFAWFEILVFRKILRAYSMNRPYCSC